ncbi:MAG TPA: NAD(P)-binding domain-containing protein [Acidimicrobiales bacterium]|nr:NAD(P)-binding domain-containing protein [Acidimicrobiales bacterium]
MRVAVIGTGFIGGILGRALAGSGHQVTFGSRHGDDDVAGDSGATVATVGDAIGSSDVVVLALPGAAVAQLASEHGRALDGRLVIDATNRMGAPVVNARAELPAGVRYARAFNTVGGENMAEPVFADGAADMFFSAPEADRATVEQVIAGVGLRPVDVGADQEEMLDALFKLWIALAMTQGRGRRLAFRLLEA